MASAIVGGLVEAIKLGVELARMQQPRKTRRQVIASWRAELERRRQREAER